jgi:aspartate-semialdehyde dehydrogenase
MESDMASENKIPVGVLGATGSVGQKFIELLSNHPWFEVREIAASEKSMNQKYKDRVRWLSSSPLPEKIAEMELKACEPDLDCRLVFSGLDSSIAGEIEENFARNGYIVVSNSKNHRMDPNVPLLVPEINPDHLKLIEYQNFGNGCIVTNPNCSTIGLVLAMKPLIDEFGVSDVNVVTMQALSGAGYPGVASLDILDNIIPYISGEEDKLELEPCKIFGAIEGEKIRSVDLKISAQCNRVAVSDGHIECIQVKLKKKASAEDMTKAWESFIGEPQKLKLPMAPEKPIYYFSENLYPQPRIHRNMDKGMAVSVGRLRRDSIFDFKFVILSHNTVRGAAGGSILCAELMKVKGYI